MASPERLGSARGRRSRVSAAPRGRLASSPSPRGHRRPARGPRRHYCSTACAERTPSRHASDEPSKASRLGGRDHCACQAGHGAVVRRLCRGVRPPLPAARRPGHLHAPVGRQAPQQLLGTFRRPRRRPCGGPHLRRPGQGGGRRADEQLDRPARAARRALRPLQRVHAGPHDVRRPLLHGSPRVAHRPDRRRGDRLRLCRRQPADHDAHGARGPRVARGGRRVRSLRALRGRSPRRRRRGLALAVQPREPLHRPLPRDPGDSGRSAPATAATPSSGRSASPSASLPSWPATRAGSPSTCSS